MVWRRQADILYLKILKYSGQLKKQQKWHPSSVWNYENSYLHVRQKKIGISDIIP